jgi:hypothetical protein
LLIALLAKALRLLPNGGLWHCWFSAQLLKPFPVSFECPGADTKCLGDLLIGELAGDGKEYLGQSSVSGMDADEQIEVFEEFKTPGLAGSDGLRLVEGRLVLWADGAGEIPPLTPEPVSDVPIDRQG